MSVVRPLALIIAEAREARIDAALSLACAAAAMGREVRLFFHGESVAALVSPSERIAGLLDGARELGIPAMACQTGLDTAALAAADLPQGVETGGLIAFLAASGDAQLTVV